jgi:hypothetical protein
MVNILLLLVGVFVAIHAWRYFSDETNIGPMVIGWPVIAIACLVLGVVGLVKAGSSSEPVAQTTATRGTKPAASVSPVKVKPKATPTPKSTPDPAVVREKERRKAAAKHRALVRRERAAKARAKTRARRIARHRAAKRRRVMARRRATARQRQSAPAPVHFAAPAPVRIPAPAPRRVPSPAPVVVPVRTAVPVATPRYVAPPPPVHYSAPQHHLPRCFSAHCG